jgi:hypothetical protein
LEESLTLFQELGYTLGVEETLISLGRVAHAQGDSVQAARHFTKSLVPMSESRFGLNAISDCLDGLAAVAGTQGQPERAARLFGAAEALRQRVNVALQPAYHAAYKRDVAAAGAQLNDATFAAAWAAGQAMSLEQAIAYVLSTGD